MCADAAWEVECMMGKRDVGAREVAERETEYQGISWV